jgi:glucose-6-phosphate 1-epimerase
MTHKDYISQLNKQFGRDKYVVFEEGKGGLPCVSLHHTNDSSAQIYLLGATVTSYKTSNGYEVIFVSNKAVYEEKKAIRGGK